MTRQTSTRVKPEIRLIEVSSKIKLTLSSILEVLREQKTCQEPAQPEGYLAKHQEEDVPRLPVVLPHVLAPQGKHAD